MLNVCLLPQLKALIDKQEAKKNSLLDLTRCCRQLCRKNHISPGSLPSLLESVSKVSLKYQDIRHVQIDCLEMMTELGAMGESEGEGVKILSDSGTLKNVIAYMQKVVMYEDVQAAGLHLLGAVLKQDPSTVEPIKFAGGIELCKAIRSAHAGSNQIRILLAPVASALMPADFLDADIKRAIDTVGHGILESDIPSTTDAVGSLSNLTSTADGVRVATHNRIGLALQDISGFSRGRNPAEVVEVVAEASKLARNICESRGGANHMARCGGVEIIGNMLDILGSKEVTDSPRRREGKTADTGGRDTDWYYGCPSSSSTLMILLYLPSDWLLS